MSKKKAAAKKPRAGSTKDAKALRHHSFVEAYIANGGNATAAAVQAGASYKSAHVIGHRLLSEVKDSGLLEQRRKQVLERLELSTERTLRRLVTLMEADITMFLDAKGGMLPPSAWPAEARGAVQSLKWGRFGPEIKLHSVQGAVGDAMKHLGLFEKDNNQKNDPFLQLLASMAGKAGLKPVQR